MASGEIVKEGDVTIEYFIVEHEVGNEIMYDWNSSNDDESRDFFETIQEAEADARRNLGA